MTSPFSSVPNTATALPPPAAAMPQKSVRAGTLAPGTLVTVGKHSVTIERWLSEGDPCETHC